MADVVLKYDLPRGLLDASGLERIAELSRGLAAARLAVDAGVECYVALGDFGHYNVLLRGDAGDLSGAADRVFKEAGTPDFVSGRYRVLEDLLGSYGKRLKRRLDGALAGKHVVDL